MIAKGIGNRGKIIVRAEAVQTSKQIAKFRMQWKSLNNLSAGFIGIGRKRQIVKFKIGRQIPGTQNFADVCSTDWIKQSSADFELPLQEINLSQLCNNNKDSLIRFSVWIKKNKLINEVQTSVNEILNDISTFNAKNGSFLILSDFSVTDKPDFVNYLRSGWGVSVFGAIDFTASNGDPSNRNSLHYRGTKSQYEQAITNVGEII